MSAPCASSRGSAARGLSLQPLYTEYNIGNYSRSFQISSKIEQEGIKAELKDGVMTLVLPKVEKAMPRRISGADRTRMAGQPASFLLGVRRRAGWPNPYDRDARHRAKPAQAAIGRDHSCCPRAPQLDVAMGNKQQTVDHEREPHTSASHIMCRGCPRSLPRTVCGLAGPAVCPGAVGAAYDAHKANSVQRSLHSRASCDSARHFPQNACGSVQASP